MTLNDININGSAGSGNLIILQNEDPDGIFIGASLTLNGSTEIVQPTGNPFYIVWATTANDVTLNDSTKLIADFAFRNDFESVLTLNDFSMMTVIHNRSGTINMYDSSHVDEIKFSFLTDSILNIYDPSPGTDGIYPTVDLLDSFPGSVIYLNLYNDPLPALTGVPYIGSIVGPVTVTANLPPIILDLNGDGVNLLSLENSSVTMAHFTDGQNAAKIGWMSPQDGMLIYDYDNDSNVTHLNEFSFVSYAPEARTDLEALSLAFDTNHDNVFDSLDAHFTQFGVWNDGNSNGIVDLNEYATLEQLGISSIKLISDNQQVFENGNIIFGYSTYTTLDGSIHQLADVGLKIAMESNVQIGTENNDVLTNSVGNDILYGNLGNDTLYGGSGSDILQGGAGADRFVMSLLGSGNNHITLEDFDPHQGDMLMIYDVLHVLDGHDDVLSALDSLASFSHPNENSTVVTFNTGDTLQINIPIDSFHDTAIASQIVVEQQPLS